MAGKAEAKKKYGVKSPIHHDGERYERGEAIELTDAEAAEMPHALEPLAVMKAEKEKEKDKDADNGATGDE